MFKTTKKWILEKLLLSLSRAIIIFDYYKHKFHFRVKFQQNWNELWNFFLSHNQLAIEINRHRES